MLGNPYVQGVFFFLKQNSETQPRSLLYLDQKYYPAMSLFLLQKKLRTSDFDVYPHVC